MRKITIEENLRLRFPGRDASFDDGVETGMLATLMAFDVMEFTRPVACHNVEQIRTLAERMGYVAAISPGGDEALMTLRKRGRRPQLRLVSTR